MTAIVFPPRRVAMRPADPPSVEASDPPPVNRLTEPPPVEASDPPPDNRPMEPPPVEASDPPPDNRPAEPPPGGDAEPQGRSYTRQMYRVTTDTNDENGYHRWLWQQTADTTATITLFLPQFATDEQKQLLRQLGVDPDDLTFAARLQEGTWVVNDPKFHRFAGLLLGIVGAAVGADLTQGGQVAPLDVNMQIKFVDRDLHITYVKGEETISSEKATPE